MDSSDRLAAAYNDVAYVSDAQPQAHPDRLATVGRLFGLRPADVTDCRVLELGCGTGGHLLPAALSLPASSFVGVDVAEDAVREGRRRAAQYGLTNAELLVADLMELDASLGTFDFIIAHGVYSWVPPAVQDQLLALCRALLAPQGIAYVSYNVLPGWHLAQASRGLMRFQMEQYEDRARQLREARGLLAMVADAQTRSSPYAQLIAQERERLADYPDWFLIHDHLAEINEPLYFSDFVDRARQHQLQFLGEADVHSMNAHGLAPWVEEALAQADTVEMREQYLDFFRGRSFRRTLLCRAEASIDRDATASSVSEFLVSAPVREVAREDGQRTYAGHVGRTIQTGHPGAEAVLHALQERWPHRLAVAELREQVGGRLEGEETLEQFLFGLYRDGFVDLHTFMPTLTTEVSGRPLASPVARRQVVDDTLVTNLLHHNVPVEDPVMRRVLASLDGTRTLEDVTAAAGLTKRGGRDAVEEAVRSFAQVALLLQ